MVPQGLVLTATMSFTLGAVRMSLRGAVVQRLNAVETMAAIDVICTDKTGTLTTNQLRLDQVQRGRDPSLEAEAKRLLARVCGSVGGPQQQEHPGAVQRRSGEPPVELLDQLPFKSQNRYQCRAHPRRRRERVLVLGAREALRPYLDEPAGGAWAERLCQTAAHRAASCCCSPKRHAWRPFDGTLDGFRLRPVLLVALSDELRPDAGQVMEALAAQGIDFKIISGDNPETVRATVGHSICRWLTNPW